MTSRKRRDPQHRQDQRPDQRQHRQDQDHREGDHREGVRPEPRIPSEDLGAPGAGPQPAGGESGWEDPYNYRHFRCRHFSFQPFFGPRPGTVARDFTVYTLDGEPVSLSDFLGRPLVIEAGSCSCPMYQARIRAMNELAGRHPEVTFLVLYSREAHPGERIRPHASWQEKLSRARSLARKGEKRTVLVDGLDGRGHLYLGGLPNLCYVLDAGGRVVFRSFWANPEMVAAALEAVDRGVPPARTEANGFRGWAVRRHLLPVLARAGAVAIADFLLVLPTMSWYHLRDLVVRMHHQPARASS